MWNSGAKGGFLGKAGNVLTSIFQGKPATSESHPVYPDLPGGLAEIRRLLGAGGTGPMEEALTGATAGQEEAMALARALAGGEGEDALFRQARGRIMPGLAARGLATSGEGIMGEYKASEEVYDRRLKANTVYQQAAQGLAILKALPIQLRQQLIQMMLNPSTASSSTGAKPSWWESLSGPVGDVASIITGGMQPTGG
jgi:hypothetical protein